MRAAKRKQLGLSDTDFVFLSVARLVHEVKGQDLLVRAFRQVREGYPSAKLVLVGVGTSLPYLSTLADGSVLFSGNQIHIEDYFSIADAFVQSSRTESFGLALAEACLTGLPAVATRTGLAASLLRDRTDALLCEPDVASIAVCMKALLESQELCERIGGNGKMRLAGRFTTQAYWEHLRPILHTNIPLA